MMHAMSKKEIKEHHDRLNEFWKLLDWNTKGRVYYLLNDFTREYSCKHDWQHFDDTTGATDRKYCRKCGLYKEELHKTVLDQTEGQNETN